MKLRTFILLIITGVATAALLYGTSALDAYNYEQDILRQFAACGLEVTGLEVTDSRVKVLLPSSKDALCPEDLQLVRYITGVIPSIETEQSIYAAVVTPAGEVIYQRFFSLTDSGSGQKKTVSPLYMDSTLLRAELDYAFSERSIVCLALRETAGEQCYLEGSTDAEERGRVLNFEIRSAADSAELTAGFLAALIDKLNGEGAGIVRYSLNITDENGVCLLLASHDLLTGAEIRLR